ncbi:hypothetical protein PoB_004526800 [Plakobranchus ocellatus]|uniref:RNase H type-1 domain-containing protein n=1 Tax=Plakobranchus ocellatus TaxID=259542 RepID=A0AAV4BIX9_9GAST|nr:hypothetical protein PoB_004526800 [Plakobranchus ocellatus]
MGKESNSNWEHWERRLRIGILWPDGTTFRLCGPVGEQNCRFDCELKAFTKCLSVITRRQREGAALPGMVIFTDCRASVQALGISGKEDLEKAVLVANQPQKTEGVKTTVQWSRRQRDSL